MERYERGEMAKTILMALVGVGMICLFIAAPGTAHIFKLFKPKNSKDRARVRQAVKRLEVKKFVRVAHTTEGEVLIITSKGKKEASFLSIDDIVIKKTRHWDGFWRVLVFDIPEEKRTARNALRRKLHRIGFYPLQKSTFIYPYECRDEVDFIGEYFSVRQFIRYIVAKDADVDINALKFFKLSTKKTKPVKQ